MSETPKLLEPSMKRPNLYLHIGWHKTGTTALQQFLLTNNLLLALKGYLYPSAGLNSGAHYALARSLDPDRKTKISAETIWGQLSEEIEESNFEHVILSSEDFVLIKDLDKLRLFTEGYQTKIIVYLRRQDGLIQSAYHQLVKATRRRLNQSIHQYVQQPGAHNLYAYVNFENHLERWKTTFGQENLIVRVYEHDQLPGGIFADFLQAIGLELTDEYVLPEEESNSNKSLSRDILEFLRFCNFLPMEAAEHLDLVAGLTKISEKIGNKTYFEQHNLLSPSERIEILKRFEASNQRVARNYLGREDGRLFYEPWPDPNDSWEPYPGLTMEKVVSIVGGLYVEQQKEINMLSFEVQKLKNLNVKTKDKTQADASEPPQNNPTPDQNNSPEPDPGLPLRKETVAFVLPEGLSLGGVTTWSVQMCHNLARINQATAIIKHPSPRYALNIKIPAATRLIDSPHRNSPTGPYLTAGDIMGYLPAYQSVLPGTLIPNWSRGSYAACAALAQSEAGRIRVIGFAHADGTDYYEWLTYFEPIIHRFVAVSREIAAELAKRLPHREPDIVVRPYAVEVPSEKNRTYSAKAEPLRLVYAGRISERQKRVSDLIGLAESLEEKEVDFRLRLIGDGSDKIILGRKISLLGENLRQRITLEDSLSPDQMPTVWPTADIFVQVSDYEGTSIAMLEAMAHGCIPVVTGVSGTATVIENGRNGFTVPVGDVAEMSRLIKALADDRSQLAKMGRQARETIAAGYAYEPYMAWFLQMVDEIWQQPPRRWPDGRPLLPLQQVSPELPKLYREVIAGFSGQDIARHIPLRRLIQAAGFKLAARPGFRWLFRLRGWGKRLLGG